MPVTIQGIRIRSITISRTDEGDDKVSADYELISSAGKVLARQSLSSRSDYGSSPTFVPSTAVVKQLNDAVAAYVKDVETHLGLA